VIVVDTTVLVYAVGDEHPLREPCRSIVQAIRVGDLSATTTFEVIQEFAHVRSRRRDRADAASFARAYADLLSPLLVPGRDQLEDGLALFEGNPRLGAFDAVLAAVALDAGADALVSADAVFGLVPGLRHVSPDGPDLRSVTGI